jgi:hypothetical protein
MAADRVRRQPSNASHTAGLFNPLASLAETANRPDVEVFAMGARILQYGDRPRRLVPSRNIGILSEELRQGQCPKLKFF